MINTLTVKRLCKLGMEWTLINGKKIHFFVPNPINKQAWFDILNKEQLALNTEQKYHTPITSSEIVHLFKHFRRYEDVIIFYDEKTGIKIEKNLMEPLIKLVDEKDSSRLSISCKHKEEKNIYNSINTLVSTNYELYNKAQLELASINGINKFTDLIELGNKRGYQTLYEKNLESSLLKLIDKLTKLKQIKN